ncbi:MAG TPA: pseudouridine synthase, partial [Longimicrobiaceae bacterium]|nr:pseudouridine synthase [Longimicrobiaceae bacterium]
MQRKRPSREPDQPPAGELRLQAYLARAGVASRRHSEELIAQGRVEVNGAVVTTPGTKVRPGRDRVAVDGRTVDLGKVVWIALHKPKGYTTSRHDQYGRETVYELLPENYQALFHVGRLDRDSEGLLLLTNDGETANRLLHPSFGTTKEYLADVEGKPSTEVLRRLVEGVELEDGTARAESAQRVRQVDLDVFRLRVVLREGKKREVRRMLEAVGHPVRRLLRQRFGPVELGELPKGKWRVVLPAELNRLTRPPRARKPATDEHEEERAEPVEKPPARRPRPAQRPPRGEAAGRPKPASRNGAKPGGKGRAKPGPARERGPEREPGHAGPAGQGRPA